METRSEKRVAMIQRVIFHYRVGFFEKMGCEWDFCLFHGDSVPGSKVINAKGPYGFKTKKLFTIKKRAKNNPQQILYFNPGLVISLIRWNPDVIVMEGSNNVINNIFVFVYCLLFRKKFIWWGIGQVPGRKDSVFRKILTPFRKTIIRCSDAVLAYCNLSAEYFKQITHNEKIKVLPNSLNNLVIEEEISNISLDGTSALRKRLGIDQDSVILLFVGAMEHNKRLEVLLDSTKSLQNKGHNIDLVLIGAGNAEKKYHDYAQQACVDNVHFLGKIIKDVNQYFQMADIFVLPGRGGLAINQALINSLPVVCNTPADGTEMDMITNGFNGYLIPDMDRDKLTERLDKIISDNLYSKMGMNSKRVVDEKFNIKTMVDVMHSVID